MKVTVTHSKITEKEKKRFVEEVTRKMLEIMKDHEKTNENVPKSIDKRGEKAVQSQTMFMRKEK